MPLEIVKQKQHNPSYSTASAFNRQQLLKKDETDGSYVQYLVHVMKQGENRQYGVEAFNCFPQATNAAAVVHGVRKDQRKPILRLVVDIFTGDNDAEDSDTEDKPDKEHGGSMPMLVPMNMHIESFFFDFDEDFDHGTGNIEKYKTCVYEKKIEWGEKREYEYWYQGQKEALIGTFFGKTGVAKWLLHVAAEDIIIDAFPRFKLAQLDLDDASAFKYKLHPHVPFPEKPRPLTPGEYGTVCEVLEAHFGKEDKKRIKESKTFKLGGELSHIESHIEHVKTSFWISILGKCLPKTDTDKRTQYLNPLLKEQGVNRDFEFECAIRKFIEKSKPEHYSDLSVWSFHSRFSTTNLGQLIKEASTWYPNTLTPTFSWFGRKL